ncbi:peptide ABC transporter ATP-binding protein [Psychromonas sp. psych-6C06]|uniref:ATP-binding cassette domain-containing protein n=1 Tax=Psychromonas sp. psych-6C06 TaxID=2058089 RepID=UPI000C33C002|nr:ATP-binding cassette domain-containing protein [Psychromonas sp. psych-6C06]PKF61086.1 peptide ABC transporter ATP-binding protein [Psychromonas sp. psych-6C06]
MQNLLNITNLAKEYRRSNGLFRSQLQDAYRNINFSLDKGKTLSIIGESGSGKSTLVQTIAGLRTQTHGEIYLHGKALSNVSLQERCKSIRMLFHAPSNSLNPKATIGRILTAPLELNSNFTAIEREVQIKKTLNLVGLLPDYLAFYPNMLSSVQQHQVALARAMILEPDIIIADEILAGLDISLRFKLVNLLLNIQEEKQVSYIMVAHNMSLVRHVSDNLIVMHQGNIVENDTTENVYNSPKSNKTKHLLQSHQPDYRK